MIDHSDLTPGFYYVRSPYGKITIMEVNDAIKWDAENEIIEQNYMLWFMGDDRAYSADNGLNGEILGRVPEYE